MNMCKKVLNFFKKTIHRKKTEKRVFYYAKNILKRGIYIVPYKKNEMIAIKNTNFTVRNLFHLYINIHKIKPEHLIENNVNKIEFSYGSGKIIIFTNKYAYGFYKTDKLFTYAKTNFQNYYKYFNYPHISIFSFIETLKCVVMQRIFGEQYQDYNHDKIIIKKLLEFCITAHFESDDFDTTYFLQHGDVKGENIIWQENSFVFIDLDGLHFLPPLFDVFHYLTNAGYDLTGILSILNDEYDLIKIICNKTETKYSDLFDNFFYEYVNYYINHLRGYYGDFKFLTIENTKDYPKTNKLLKSIT